MKVTTVHPSEVVSSSTNNTLTGAIALIGGAATLAVVGGGVGVVGAFGAVGLGAFEIFTGGAVLSGIAAHRVQKNLSTASDAPTAPTPTAVEDDPNAGMTSQEIIDLQRGVF